MSEPARSLSQATIPTLSPVERNAFQELTRKLHERLTASNSPPEPPAADGALSNSAGAALELPQGPLRQDRALEVSVADLCLALKRAQAEILELTAAKRQAETSASARFDFLAKISHEFRTQLYAIIGFSEIMAQEMLGPLGSARYRKYLVDIGDSGEQLLSLVNDLVDLSRIDAGKLELDFAGVALNPLALACIATRQLQANRERIIIRTSLSPKLPPVLADARSIRQIVRNLISGSATSTGGQAGGQVIVSTTLTDRGEVALRVRDSGLGMSPGSSGISLPLARALAEANRATFHIKRMPEAGTLIEVVFPPDRVLAEAGR